MSVEPWACGIALQTLVQIPLRTMELPVTMRMLVHKRIRALQAYVLALTLFRAQPLINATKRVFVTRYRAFARRPLWSMAQRVATQIVVQRAIHANQAFVSPVPVFLVRPANAKRAVLAIRFQACAFS